jgi:phosphonate transport system substrate-binding protein
MKRILVTLLLGLSLTAVVPATNGRCAGEAQQTMGVLRIGILPEQDIFSQMQRYRPLANYLSAKLGVAIELKILTRYGNVIDNFTSLGLDGAFFGSFSYALAHMKLGVQVLARPEQFNGSSTYRGLIFVRKESGIKTPKDTKGKVFVFVDKATTAGYLLPLHWYIQHGIRDYTKYLRESYFAGTHEDAILDVLHGKADIGAAKNTVFEALARKYPQITTELTILATSPEVPENALALRNGSLTSLRVKLTQILISMHNDPEGNLLLQKFGARRFVETTDKDYDPVFKYAAEIGLDLGTYDYRNE